MNPLAQEALGSIIRWVLTFLAGWFVQHGIWTANDAEKYVAGAALAILALSWSLWAKYKSRLKLVTALGSRAAMSEHEVEYKIAAGHSASTTTPKDAVPAI